MLGGIGAQELLLIFLVVLLLFGAKRIPDIAQGLGKGIREFKQAMNATKEELNKTIDLSDKESEMKRTGESANKKDTP